MMLCSLDSVLELRKRRACWTCGAAAVELCYGCKLAFYCSAACQRTARSHHKLACIALAASFASEFPEHDAV
jgi:hypothetical protein